MIFFAFLIIPIIVALVGFLVSKGEITLKEFGVQMLAQIIIIGAFAGVSGYRNTLDYETWNGAITAKDSRHVSCSHSYSCNCYTQRYTCGSKPVRTCTRRVCQTCYEHSYDVSWYAVDSAGQNYTISRVDRQGLSTPPRWASIQIGEPTSSTHSYENFIKGNPDSLFRKTGLVEKFKDTLPEYPSAVYDYYRLNHLVLAGVAVSDAAEWNKGLASINADLGPSKQVNAVVVVTNQSREWYSALEQHWIGGKKNDAITVIGVDSAQNITWVEIMSLSNELFKIKLRDAVYNVGKLDRENVLAQIRIITQNHFTRREMKDFEYLSATIQPSVGEWVFGLILGLITSIGLSVVFHKNDFF